MKLVLWHRYSIEGSGHSAHPPSRPMSSAIVSIITLFYTFHLLCTQPRTSGPNRVIKMFNRTLDMLSGDCFLLKWILNFESASVHGFYSASALLAMQSAVLASGILSVCPSVTFRYCVQMNEDTIVQFSASDRIIPLVSAEVTFIRIFAGDHPQRGR